MLDLKISRFKIRDSRQRKYTKEASDGADYPAKSSNFRVDDGQNKGRYEDPKIRDEHNFETLFLRFFRISKEQQEDLLALASEYETDNSENLEKGAGSDDRCKYI